MTTKEQQKIATAIKRHFGVKDVKWRNHPGCDWAIRLFVGEIEDMLPDNERRTDFIQDCGF